MTRTSLFSIMALGGVLTAVLIGGCDALKTSQWRFLSPQSVIVKSDRESVGPILEAVSLLDQEQSDDLLPNSTFPSEADLQYTDEDYVIGPTDVLDISILDLFSEGLETVLRREVSDSGYIDLPQLPERIKAEGLNKEQLKDSIRRAYSPDILTNPQVSVTIAARRQNTFSVLGAIARPGTYAIVRKDMRLLQGLAMPGGIIQSNINYIYVIRQQPATRVATGPEKPGDVGPIPEMVEPTRPAAPIAPAPAPAPARAPEPATGASAPAPETPPATVPATVPAPAPAAGTAPAKAGPTTAEQEKALEELLRSLAPGGDASPAPGVMVQFSETAATSSVPTTAEDVEMPSPGANEKWVFTNGRWIRVRQEPPAPQAPAPAPATGPAAPRETPREIVPPAAPQRVARKPVVDTEAAPQDPFGWKKALQTDTARIIAINLRSLQNGDPRMNIVIRDNDVVWVPTLEVGEFYVNGEVNRPGVYSLTGRKITVKQAMTAAGNLGQLAWPENSALVRRIGDNQEQVIPINVEAIFQGRDPDIYLKPNDVILVGTSAGAPFLAVVRNAFRMTYGFGFIYDRNFSDPLIGTPDSRRFTMW